MHIIHNKHDRIRSYLVATMVALLTFSFGSAQATNITTNTTWTTSHIISNGLTISNNATLTISGSGTIISVTGNVDVKSGSILIIENNATLKTEQSLILENATSFNGTGATLHANSGATLTSLNGSWNGIQVWGPIAYGYNGEALAKFDNATVEKAYIAVATYNTTTNSHKGGTIQADNTLFRNNRFGVRVFQNPAFLAQSQNGPFLSAPTNSASYFKLCHFLNNMTDNPFYPLTGNGNTFLFNQMIGITDAKGVSILGCLFEDQTNQHYSAGVNAFNSEVRVAPATATIHWGNYYFNYTQPSTFLNMVYGVMAAGPGTFSRLIVQQSRFDDNEQSITLIGQNKSIIVNNTLTNIGGVLGGIDGIELFGCSNYTVENNTIQGLDDYTQGIYPQNSGEQYNELYKNIITNTGKSVFANGQNRNESGGSGLEILCNNFQVSSLNSTIGLYVGTYPGELNSGIANFQGIVLPNTNYYNWLAAGNLFASQTGPVNLNYDRVYKDQDALLFTYGYSNASSYENPVYANVPLSEVSPNSCPTHSFTYIDFPTFTRNIRNIETQINTIEQKSEKTKTDSLRLSGFLRQHQLTIDSMMATYMYGNSDEVRYDSIAYALQQVQYGYYNKIKLAGVYLMQLRYTDAINLLSNLQLQYSLNENQLNDVNNIKDMYIIIDSLAQNGDNWDELPSEMQQQVETVAQSSGSYGPPVAKYLLLRYKNIYPDAVHINSQSSAQMYHFNSGKLANEIYPNPATNQIFYNWKDKENGRLQLFNLSGNMISETEIHFGLNQIKIEKLASGIYSVRVLKQGKTVYQQKIIKK